MLDRFGSTSAVGRHFILWSYDLYQAHRLIPLVSESFTVWRGLYKEATNLDQKAKEAVKKFARLVGVQAPDVELFLFAVETYMAVLMKLLLAETAIQKKIVSYTSLRSLLGKQPVDGYRNLSHRVPFLRSVFEEDVFDWFLEPTAVSKKAHDEVAVSLTDMADALDNLDFKGLKADLIRELYHGFFDASTRKALGEFYTKENVVDEILDFTGYNDTAVDSVIKDSGILLDPACGSGTFLVRAIAKWSAEIDSCKSNPTRAAELLKTITNNIVGIDIHPFAVSMARANYLLAIIDLLTPSTIERLGEVKVPVYWTDSLLTRKKVSKITTNVIEVEVPLLGVFELPPPEDLDWDDIAKAIRTGLINGWSDSRLLDEFKPQQRLAYQGVLLDLYHWFVKRQQQGKDGRWISVLRNSSIVYELGGRCSYVVGNPPWVRIHNIDESIRKRLRGEFKFYRGGWNPKLVWTKARFKEQYDYCMAFVESGLNYLRQGGKLGFVITSKIMQSLYAGSMRNDLVKNNRILHLKDYSIGGVELFRDATNYPLILIVEKLPPGGGSRITVEMIAHGQLKTWETDQQALPLTELDPYSCWMIAPPEAVRAFRKMQSNRPRIGDRFEVNMGVKTSANEVFLLKNVRHSATRGVVVAETEDGNLIRVEESLLRPFVRGEDIAEYSFQPSGYIIWTHDDNGDVLKKLPPEAEAYFNETSIKNRLTRRDDYKKGQPTWTIFRVTPKKLEDKVAWPELAKEMEVTFLPKYHTNTLGKRKLIPIQTVYFVSVTNEALGNKLTRVLNSTPVRSFIFSFAERARGGYFRHISWTVGLIPLPGLDGINESESSVAKAYGLNKTDLTSLEDFYSFIKPR